jgi:hypothetical protein
MLLRPTAAPIVANVKPVGLDQKFCGLLMEGSFFGEASHETLGVRIAKVFA